MREAAGKHPMPTSAVPASASADMLTKTEPQDIKRHFPNALDLGANTCNIARALTEDYADPEPSIGLAEASPDAIEQGLPPPPEPLSSRVGRLLAVDSSASMLYRDADEPFNARLDLTRQVLADDETLPFPPESFDLVLSSLSLHWINDLPGVLAQVNRVLKPDRPFIGAMFGEDTLYELRGALQLAEQERRGGVSPHVSPLARTRDAGALLQRSGFQLLTVDMDEVVVEYPNTFALMADLQAMGEGNAIAGREMGAIGRDVLVAADAIYREMYGDEQGNIPATFRVIYMIGWRESPDQAKPLARGSGDINLKDALRPK